jgi:uncharacterized protein YdhG (YjbR/CyaY superfamily)
MAFSTIDTYIASCAAEQQEWLEQMRQIIRKAAPKAEETISYAIPTFRLNNRNLVHFAANKNHIGLYPGPAVIDAFATETAAYKGSKASIHFPYDKPLPKTLITRMVKAGIQRNEEKLAKRMKK